MILSRVFNTADLFAVQNKQYSEILLMSGIVPPAATQQMENFQTNVSTLGAFYCKFWTGNFTGVSGCSPLRDGISHLRGQLIDGSNSRPLFNDFIPFDLLFSPGYTRAYNVPVGLPAPLATDVQSNNLFYPTPFDYLFSDNSNIQMNIKNDSDQPISFNIAFWGVRIKKQS